MTWPFGDLQPLAYDFIMADPPWSFDNWSAAGEAKNAKAQYDCTGLDWIKSLPVSHLASKDCLLWLWATNPMLPQAIETLAAWGFTFKTAGTWLKTTSGGKVGFGTGYVLRSSNEPFLLATRGLPNEPYLIGTLGKPRTSRSVRSGFLGLAREHSRKPEEGFAAAEALMPGARRLELFSRQSRPGWDTWGNQADKFDEVAV